MSDPKSNAREKLEAAGLLPEQLNDDSSDLEWIENDGLLVAEAVTGSYEIKQLEDVWESKLDDHHFGLFLSLENAKHHAGRHHETMLCQAKLNKRTDRTNRPND